MAEIGRQILNSNWVAARSTEVDHTGIQLTTTHPPPSGDHLSPPWIPAVVPGTVLATLVENKLVPDPFYGLENERIIDIADSGREHYTFWFFTKFECKSAVNQHVDLNFRAINYSAEVFLNGHKKVLPKGMFRRHSLDITDILSPEGQNLLAVIVYPPDHPGTIPPQGGQGGDHEIGKDVAAQYVEGWDWMTPIRDRNTGIWDEVSLSITGPVKIIDPHLVSTFFDDYKRVYLYATTELENRSNWVAECSLNIQVSIELEDNVCLVEHVQTEHLSIPPGARVQYSFPKLFFYKPNLWWPNGMGKQPLYNVNITVDVEGFGESDTWNHLFGFRKIESTIDESTGGRLFKVNGQPVFIRGGNWILSDGLLRLSEKRYETDIRFHADMNLNMMRCWGGGLAERPEFYHFCDVYGLLVWQEFWITGDVDGRGVPISNPNGPLDHDLFLICARDTVKLLRNHASLALWVGGNEQVPPQDINDTLKQDLKLHPHFIPSNQTIPSVKGTFESYDTDSSQYIKHNLKLHPHFITSNETIPTAKDTFESSDSSNETIPSIKGTFDSSDTDDPSQYLDGTRVYVQGSMWDGFADGKGDFTDGPYEIQNPENFFKDDYYKYGFNPEVGSIGMPVADTIRASMPIEGWEIPVFKNVDGVYVEEVPNRIWDYHKYIPYSKPGSVHDQILMYGTPVDLDDFCLKAQLVNYVQYRALLEGWTSHMWTKFTGVLIWKTQNPWTGLRGQFYDHFLDQTAGFYGCRSAAEPIHVQLNLATYYIEVVNTTSNTLFNTAIEVSVWDPDGNCSYYKIHNHLTVPPKKTVPITEMNYPKSENPSAVYFLLLKLYCMSDHGILSRNFYWLYLPGGDYKLLEGYRTKKVPLKISSKVVTSGTRYEVEVQLENRSKNPNPNHHLLINGFYPRVEYDGGSHSEVEIQLENKSKNPNPNNARMVDYDGGSHTGVAFFLHFSVHSSKMKENEGEEDTRILPVHYSDNYFSLVPGETMSVRMNFEVREGVSPTIVLNGWNINDVLIVCEP